LLTCLI